MAGCLLGHDLGSPAHGCPEPRAGLALDVIPDGASPALPWVGRAVGKRGGPAPEGGEETLAPSLMLSDSRASWDPLVIGSARCSALILHTWASSKTPVPVLLASARGAAVPRAHPSSPASSVTAAAPAVYRNGGPPLHHCHLPSPPSFSTEVNRNSGSPRAV